MSRTLLVCVPSSNLSLAGDLAQFIRTDVLLACVRERVKNVHATYTVKNATHPDSGFPGSPPCTCVSFVCASTSTQSINPEIVFTLHIIERATSNGGFSKPFFLLHSRMPIPHIRRGQTLWLFAGGTHSHRFAHWWISNPTTSFQGSTASQLFLATTTPRVLSSSAVCFPTMLLCF